MNYLELKYSFYILLVITLILYFVSDILRYKIANEIESISKYIEKENILDIPFIKVAYSDFQNNFTVKNYLKNYDYLLSKKNHSNLSNQEQDVLDTLEKDIELLKISFLSSIVLDNQEHIEEELFLKIKKFISIIKSAQVVKFFKVILTIISFTLFFKIIFKLY